MNSIMSSSANFFKLPFFAVVGASNDRTKFGNKVLRCYIQNGKKASPISPKRDFIEEVKCFKSLTEFSSAISSEFGSSTLEVGVSIITPPGVTKAVLDEGVKNGYRNFFLQPGTTDNEVDEYIENLRQSISNVNIIKGCVLIELGCD